MSLVCISLCRWMSYRQSIQEDLANYQMTS